MTSDFVVSNVPIPVKKALSQELRRLAQKFCKGLSSVSNLDKYLDPLDALDFARPEPVPFSDVHEKLMSHFRDAHVRDQLRKGLDVLPPTFVPYEAFRKTSLRLFESVLKRIIRSKRIVCHMHNRKSNAWMILAFLKHVRDVHPDAYLILKPRLAFHHKDTQDSFGNLCVYSAIDSIGLCLDDCAYSGSQLAGFLRWALPFVHNEMIVGVAYCSDEAKATILATGLPPRNLICARGMASLSKKAAKTLVDLDVLLSPSKKLESFDVKPVKIEGWVSLTSVFHAIGLYAPTRTIFEHKLPDSVSVPKYLCRPLKSILSSIAERFPYSLMESKIQKLKLKPPSDDTFLLGDAFCYHNEPNKRDCFSETSYSTLLLPGGAKKK